MSATLGQVEASAPGVVIRVVDLETTGSRPPDAAVVEIGWQDVLVTPDGGARLLGATGSVLVAPGVPITPQTSAIHHIIDEDVRGAASFADLAPSIVRPEARPGAARVIALAAHRASFERSWCGDRLTGGLPWICTYKSALRVWPDAPSHSNQSLRYWRRPEGLDRARALPAHRAGPDSYVTAHLLRDMLCIAGLDALLAHEREPALLVRVPYGPLRGQRFEALGDEALAELAGGKPADLSFSARHEQQRRSQAGDVAAASVTIQTALDL